MHMEDNMDRKQRYLVHAPNIDKLPLEEQPFDVYAEGEGYALRSAIFVAEGLGYCDIYTPVGEECGADSEKYPGRKYLGCARATPEGVLVNL